MKEFVKKLGKYNLSFSREVFYVLLHCIDKKIDNHLSIGWLAEIAGIKD